MPRVPLQSSSPEQLQEMMQGKFGDPELENELAKLAKELDFLNPQGKRYNFSGNEEIDLLAAMELMREMDELDQLEQQMQRAQYDGRVDNIDPEKLQELLGDEALENLEEMKTKRRRCFLPVATRHMPDIVRLLCPAFRKHRSHICSGI